MTGQRADARHYYVRLLAVAEKAIATLILVTGMVLATEHHPDAAAEAERLLHLTVEGVSPAGSA